MDPNNPWRKAHKLAGESDWEALDRRRRATTPVPMSAQDQEMLKTFDWSGLNESAANAEAGQGGSAERPITRRQSTANSPRNRERWIENGTRSRSQSLSVSQSGASRRLGEMLRGRSPTPRPLGDAANATVPAASELQQRDPTGEVNPLEDTIASATTPVSPQIVPLTSGPQQTDPTGKGKTQEDTVASSSQNRAITDDPVPPRSLNPQIVPPTSGPQQRSVTGEGEPPKDTVTGSSQTSAATGGLVTVPSTRRPQRDDTSAPSSSRQRRQPSIKTVSRVSERSGTESTLALPKSETSSVKPSKLTRVVKTLFAKLKRLVKRNPAPAAVGANDVAQPVPPAVKGGLLAKLKKIVKPGTQTNPAAPADLHQGQQFPQGPEQAAIFSQLLPLDFNRSKGELTRLEYSHCC